MDQDSMKIGGVIPKIAIENDEAPAKIAPGMHRAAAPRPRLQPSAAGCQLLLELDSHRRDKADREPLDYSPSTCRKATGSSTVTWKPLRKPSNHFWNCS